MNRADICALIGNALDNAIECEEKEEQRSISLYIHRHGQMVMIHMENTCTVPPHFSDGIPVSTKENGDMHGFGTKSMQYIARKYESS